MTALDMEHLNSWIGKREQAQDVVSPGLMQRLRATLSGPLKFPERTIPLCSHWCFAPPAVEEADTGPDGHPVRGGFLPPVPLERRMWAGGTLEFLQPFEIGNVVTRSSTIASISHKTGRSGALVFVGVDHEISTAKGLCIKERQNIVYRDAPTGEATNKDVDDPEKAPGPTKPGQYHHKMQASTLLMFRYSALTFNGHRIHYDKDYATGEEGYKDLVFHGPLQATLLANMAAILGGKPPTSFDYKGVAPLFANDTFTLNANKAKDGFDLWTADSQGQRCMVATARFNG